MIQMLANQTTAVDGAAFEWPGGQGVMAVGGTTDGATVGVEFSPDRGTTWIQHEAMLLDAEGYATFDLPPCQIRAVLTNHGAGTSLSCWYGKVTPSVR